MGEQFPWLLFSPSQLPPSHPDSDCPSWAQTCPRPPSAGPSCILSTGPCTATSCTVGYGEHPPWAGHFHPYIPVLGHRITRGCPQSNSYAPGEACTPTGTHLSRQSHWSPQGLPRPSPQEPPWPLLSPLTFSRRKTPSDILSPRTSGLPKDRRPLMSPTL